jgi:flagella basal body P-ring formation protein FlgA
MLILLVGLIGVQAVFAGQATIALKAQAMVEPGVIRLEQIAEIKGDKEIIGKISDLEVGKVAEPGRKTRLTENVVKIYVKSVVGSKDIVFNGAKFSDVTARSGTVSADSVKSLLLMEVRSRMDAGLQEGKDWIFEASKVPSISVPESGGSILVNLSPQFAGIGQEVATVQVFNGKKAISKHSVPYTVKRFEYVAEMKNGIRKGEVIGKDDFKMVRQETTFQKRKVIKKAEEAAGRTALRTLKAGELLVDNALIAPYAVKEGETVKVFVQVGNAVVQTTALAQKNAFKGQTISLKNIDTGRNISATVSGVGEAWVN